MRKIRLLLVDDHEVVRTGLKSFLQTQPGLEVIGEASNGLEAMEKSAELCPDVILMDITMPEMDGLETTRRMAEHCPKSNVLALTVYEDKQYFFEMLAAGAQGYVTKQAAADELVAAIRAVAAGNVYLQPALARWLLDDYRSSQRKDRSISNRIRKKYCSEFERVEPTRKASFRTRGKRIYHSSNWGTTGLKPKDNLSS